MRWIPNDVLSWGTLGLVCGFELGLGAVAWGMGWMVDLDVLESLRLSRAGFMVGFVAALPMIAVIGASLRWHLPGLTDLSRKMEDFSAQFFAPFGIVGIAFFSLCAGIGEEILTRGLVHAFCLRHVTPIVALILTGVVFGLMHPISRVYVIFAVCTGIYLGIVFTFPDSGTDMLAPIVAHALYDFVAILVLCKIGLKRARLK